MTNIFNAQCKSSWVVRIITLSLVLLALILITGSLHYIKESTDENFYDALAIILLDLFILVIIIFFILEQA